MYRVNGLLKWLITLPFLSWRTAQHRSHANSANTTGEAQFLSDARLSALTRSSLSRRKNQPLTVLSWAAYRSKYPRGMGKVALCENASEELPACIGRNIQGLGKYETLQSRVQPFQDYKHEFPAPVIKNMQSPGVIEVTCAHSLRCSNRTASAAANLLPRSRCDGPVPEQAHFGIELNLSSARFKSSSFWPASASLPAAVRR